MLAEKQKAAVLPTAPKNNQHNKGYRNITIQSSVNLKEKIGELLLYLQNPLSRDRWQKTWRIFELKLRQYLDLKVREVPV